MAFAQAALSILEGEGFEALTPARVAREAGSARTTFYLHFREPWQPVRDALVAAFAAEFPEVLESRDRESEEQRVDLDPETLLAAGRPLSYPLFAHVESHERAYTTIFADERGAPIVRSLTHLTALQSQAHHQTLRDRAPNEVDAEMVASYLAGALVQSAGTWIMRSPRKSATEMSYWFSELAAPGLLATMGLSDLLEE